MSKMHFQKNQKKNSKGFYIALGVCLIAIGAAAWTTYSGVKNYLTPETPTQSAPKEAGKTVSGVTDSRAEGTSSAASSQTATSSDASSSKIEKKESSVPASSKEETSSVSSAAEEPKQTAAAPSSYAFPSGRTVTKEYSGENPVYSLTMNDWRVHQGTDFAADKGSVVKSVAPGVVTDVKDDPLMGKVIVIDHGGGIEAYYCGLGDTVLVNTGDTVTAAQEIGSVKSVPCECVEESHLHLEMKKDGAWVDPMSLLDDEA